ncbi:MAG TPA: WXG100 family type VII secretion target [Candidatus Dormibacteraeota bacterium]|nr:WXG100 family type VII secretion target [Candidatus Dormibacteraeota bacterium]
MTELRLTQGELQERAAQVRQHAQEVQDALDAAHARVQALLADWSGQAQVAFADLWTVWRQSANDCHRAMDEIASRMLQAGTVFESNEQDVARALS